MKKLLEIAPHALMICSLVDFALGIYSGWTGRGDSHYYLLSAIYSLLLAQAT